jgi:hypothetical protein
MSDACGANQMKPLRRQEQLGPTTDPSEASGPEEIR